MSESKSVCRDKTKFARDLADFRTFLATHNITDDESARNFVGLSPGTSSEKLNKKLYRRFSKDYHPDHNSNKPQEWRLINEFLHDDKGGGKELFFPSGFTKTADLGSCNDAAFDLWVRAFKDPKDPGLYQRFNELPLDQLEHLFGRVDTRNRERNLPDTAIKKTKQYDDAIRNEYGTDPFHDLEYGINRLKKKGILPENFELAEKRYAVPKEYSYPKTRDEYMKLVKAHIPHYKNSEYVAREVGVQALKAEGVVSPAFKLQDCSVHYTELAKHYFPHNYANGMTMKRGMEKLKNHGLINDSFQCPEVMTYDQCKVEHDAHNHKIEASAKGAQVYFNYPLPPECDQFDLAGRVAVDSHDEG